jgi:hypothetical protein
MKKSMGKFTEENAGEIDRVINGELFKHDGKGGRGTIPNPAPSYSQSERRLWVLNNEGLYSWARREGVSL